METVTVLSKGQIAIPKLVRDALNISPGTRLTLDVRGQEIVLSKEPALKKLEGMLAGDKHLMDKFAEARKREREPEDSKY